MPVSKRSVIFAIFVLIICGCDHDEFDEGGKETPLPGQTFSVSGIVRGSMLCGGTLTASGTEGQGSFSTTTDETGAWQIENVPVGLYHVTVAGGVWIDADGNETENAGTLAGAFRVTTGDLSNLTIGMRSTLFFCGIMYPEIAILEAFSPKLKNGDFEKTDGGLDTTAVMNWYVARQGRPPICPFDFPPFSFFCQLNVSMP